MTLNRLLSTTLLAATLATAPLLAPQAMAQDAAMGAEIAAQDGKIDAFITAALAVSETRARYIAQLETVTDEAEQIQIVEEADAAILDVVEATPDISIDEYIAIGEAAAVDPELAARIDARFAEAYAE
ncbi:MAG: DUF4168 domain-containing protein [Roseinatronobacter sp.]|jgi:hypothetical protein|nr:DUF4168 domain-containing protein [Roseinatronobacter sp.]